jgi:hypothetical protein
MINPSAAVADLPYLERQMIVVSKQEIVHAAEEEMRKEVQGNVLSWASFPTAVTSILTARRLLPLGGPSAIAVGIAADVAVRAFTAWAKARESGLPILQISTEQASKLSFPPGHPRFGVVYIAHPAPSIKNIYFPMADFHRVIMDQKLSEAVLLLMSLGATSIRAEHIVGAHRDVGTNAKIKTPGNGAGLETEASIELKSNKSLRFEGVLSGKNEPSLFDNHVWYLHEPTWQMVHDGRRKYGMTSFVMEVSYLDDFGINSKLEGMLTDAGLEFGGKFEDHKSSVWKLEGEFTPRLVTPSP